MRYVDKVSQQSDMHEAHHSGNTANQAFGLQITDCRPALALLACVNRLNSECVHAEQQDTNSLTWFSTYNIDLPYVKPKSHLRSALGAWSRTMNIRKARRLLETRGGEHFPI